MLSPAAHEHVTAWLKDDAVLAVHANSSRLPITGLRLVLGARGPTAAAPIFARPKGPSFPLGARLPLTNWFYHGLSHITVISLGFQALLSLALVWPYLHL